MTSITLAIDAMGGDHGPEVTVPAAVRFAQRSTASVFLVGRPEILTSALKQCSVDKQTAGMIEIIPAEQVVDMDEKPVEALRRKKQSSMRIAINLVKEGKADACVSAGNTGALMATSRFVLKTVPGIDRPAIITAIPGLSQPFYMLDLGANVDCTADQLKQFAQMGTLLSQSLGQSKTPRVGVLNIGSEDIKGNDQVKQANALLSELTPALNYVGYVEADQIFFDVADVVVCDGFVGNVALKSMEGVAKMIAGTVKNEVKRNWWLKLTLLLAKPAWSSIKQKLDPGRYNGASMIGLLGTVVKSHGGADVSAFTHAIQWAHDHAQQQIPQILLEHFAE